MDSTLLSSTSEKSHVYEVARNVLKALLWHRDESPPGKFGL